MSKNRSDWFNPNNPAFRIRQTQIRGNFSYPSFCSRPVQRCCYSIDTFLSGLNSNVPLVVPDDLKEYLSYDKEKGDFKFSFKAIEELIELEKKRKRRYKMLFG